MKSIKFCLLLLLLTFSSGLGFSERMNTMENEISGEGMEGRSSKMDSETDYDPSFLDDILGPEYFDDSEKEERSPKDTKKESNQLSNGVPVIPDPDNVEVESEISTEKAICMGCPVDVSIEDPKIKEIATFAFQTYDSYGDDDPARSFVRVIKAQTQIVAGQKFILQIEAAYLNCTKAKYVSSSQDCSVDPEKGTLICDFEVIEQSWAERKEVVFSECRDASNIQDDIEGVDTATGSNSEQSDWDDTTLGGGLGGSDESTEMSSYRRKKRDTSSSSVEPVAPSHGHPVGKLREAEESPEILMEMAKLAVEQLDQIDEDEDKRFPLQVLKAKKQTVSGWLYHLKVRVAQTSCKEGKNSTLEECKDKMTLPYSICNVKILFQPWQTVQKKVTESQCFPEKMKTSKKIARKLFFDSEGNKIKIKNNRILKKHKGEKGEKSEDGPASGEKIVGAPTKVSPDSPELQSLVEFAVDTMDAQSNALHAQKLVKVINVERQLVSGILTKMTLETGYTDCRKNPHLDKSKCNIDEQREHQFCEIHVWEKPWLNEKKVTKSRCGKREEIMKRKKRSLIGGDDHDYKPHNSKPKPVIGGDDHDYKPHKTVIGGDDHDYKAHKSLIGGDDHDYKPHKPKIGGDDHDYKAHKPLIGGDDHDYKPHNPKPKPLIGDHDYKNHKPLIGGDDHDYNAHQIAEFGSFLEKYGKKYENLEEYKYRLGVYHENMKKVKLLQENEQGTATYGATIFADLTDEEFSQRHLGLRPDLRQRSKVKKAKIPPVTKLPEEFDWRHYNAVTPVKNQGSCGSCWAFSVTGNIEGLYARKHQNLISFSEQELVDCDTLDSGCGGGLPENAYKALQKLGGLEPEQDYPYDGRNEKCHFKAEEATAKVTGFVEISQNETAMAAWLLKNGPISIGINANAMQFYFGGVSHPWKYLCSPKSLDHGVLIVGYGVHTSSIRHKILPYWLVKNSWGPHWGEQGYYRVYRGDGTCGVNQMATSAVIA